MLISWHNKNPFMTYQALVEIILELHEGTLIGQVCKTILENANLHKHSKIQGTTRLLMTPSLNACLLLLAFHLLMQSGDIESNPGPSDDELKIEDLHDIYTKLKPVGSKWLDFGLSLGLDHDSLSALESKYRGDPEICLREMLAARLKSGGPLTWSDVCSCLRKTTIGREDLAQQIESICTVSMEIGDTEQSKSEVDQPTLESHSPAYKDEVILHVFQNSYCRIVETISEPEMFAARLYSAQLITPEMRDKALNEQHSPQSRTMKLVSAVEVQIRASPKENFKKFVRVLSEDKCYQSLARFLDAKLDDECVQPRKKEFDRPVKTMKMDTASSVHASDTYDKEQDINFEMEQPVISVPDTQAVSEEKHLSPVIKRQPIPADVEDGGLAEFSVEASGERLSYQWFGPNGTPLKDKSGKITGATTATLQILDVKSEDLGNYPVFVSNAGGPVVSVTATLSIFSPPVIERHPTPIDVEDGGLAEFSVKASGKKLSYQWFGPNGTPLADKSGKITGATRATLQILDVQSEDLGNYLVHVSNVSGPKISASATLRLSLSGHNKEAELELAKKQARDWKDDVWKGKPKLWVYFMNPNSIAEWKWKYRGDPITVSLIIEWAKGWKIPDIKTPIFDITERSDTADIRVKFSDSGISWSEVGKNATRIEKNKPTMILCLKGLTPDLQKSYIVHFFGHALGLMDEHEYSDIWRVLEKYMDVEKTRDPYARWSVWEQGPPVNKLSEYDPHSIMHVWVDINWIKDVNLQTLDNIDHNSELSEEEKKCLKGLHVRSKMGWLPKEPSLNDYKLLAEAYGGHILKAKELAKQQAPTITSPIKVQVDKDGTAIFTVVASGEKLTYQWFGPDRKDLSDIPGKISGATTPVLKIFDVQLDDHDVENYQVIVSNANGGSVISYAARLANIPVIVTPPRSVSARIGGSASFTVDASGALTYQWFGPGGVALANIPGKIAGADNDTLHIFSIRSIDFGDYQVHVSNKVGRSIISPAATLSK